MRCYRSAGMAACIVSDRLIFLDLVRDRYFSLEPVQDSMVRMLLTENTSTCERRADAIPLPVLSSQDFASVEIAAPNGSAIDTPLPKPSGPSVAAALLRNTQALIATKSLSLDRLVNRPRRAPRRQRNGPSLTVPLILAAHTASHRLLSAHNRCLPFSMALTRHLRQHHHAVDLIFGVKVDPFAAHAWVQQDGRVLNDDLEHARSFHPILVA